jgi:hypothetical protein
MSENVSPLVSGELTADEVIALSRKRAFELYQADGELGAEAYDVFLLSSRFRRILHDAGVSIDTESHFYVELDSGGRPCLMMYPMRIGTLRNLVHNTDRNVSTLRQPATSSAPAADEREDDSR